MKKISIILILFLANLNLKAQENVITTGVPFLLVAADARSAALADQGVATSPDAFSNQWNAAKFAFIDNQMGFSVSYTPYLTSLVNDISLGQVTFYNKLNDRSAFSAGLRYFGLGEIELRKTFDDPVVIVKPNELALEGSYSLKLSEKFSMGIGAKYIRSNLKIPSENEAIGAANTFAVDISGYFEGEEKAYADFNGKLRMGFNFQNLGPKISYDKVAVADKSANFLPAHIKLGAGYDFAFDEYNKLTLSVEIAKLLVPTPFAKIEPVDTNGNGQIDIAEANAATAANALKNEEYQNIGWTSGIFRSFNDAPGGMSEELRELTYSLGAEYNYQDSFALRMGYFKEDPNKGARNFFSLGAGFKYTTIKIDVSYLFNASKVKSPLENTLRFSLSFAFGDDYSK
jgi:Type IX secretion system protein PorV